MDDADREPAKLAIERMLKLRILDSRGRRTCSLAFLFFSGKKDSLGGAKPPPRWSLMDFYQHGPVALHDFHTSDGSLRPVVAQAAASRASCVLLPMLYDEMTRPAIRGIRDGLRQLDYLNELVVPLTADNQAEVDQVRRFFSDMPFPVRVLWCEGPEVQEVLAGLADRGLDLRNFRGKGLAVWLGMGAASVHNEAMVIHDADIENYDPRFVDRLLLPVINSELEFFIAKGYYARLTDSRLYGRVVRLFVWPFLDALQGCLPTPSPFLAYLRSFRYPLSGEMGMTADLARNLRVPPDWGLEVGLLGEVYRNASAKRICQVDLGYYSHKHKKVGASSSDGLQRMVVEIATSIMRMTAATEGTTLPPDLMPTLSIAYRREVQDSIRRYHADSVMNRLQYDRHEEEMTAERFECLLAKAGQTFREAPLAEQISDWIRAISAQPDAPEHLHRASLSALERDRLQEAALASVE